MSVQSYTASFTAAEQKSGLLYVRPNEDFVYSVSNVFVGTLKLEYSLDGGSSWAQLVSTTTTISSTTKRNDFSNKPIHVRWRCNAYSSGTADVTLAGAAEVTQSIVDADGNPVFNVVEGGAQFPGTLTVAGALTAGATSPSSLILPAAAAPAQTAEGSVVWDSDDDLLTVGDGSSRKIMADTSSTQTLAGKTLTTPNIGVATATTVNKVAITAPATGSTLTIPDGVTLTGPAASGTAATLAGAEALTNKTLTNPVVNRTAQKYVQSDGAFPGLTAGWALPYLVSDVFLYTLPALKTAATLTFPVSSLKPGWTITDFFLIGQIESAGGAVTVDAALVKLTAAAADVVSTNLGAMTQISVVADTAITIANSLKTLAVPEVIGDDETYYILITATTAAATDIALQGVGVIVNEV